MPTGYTNLVAENDDVTFAEFTWHCARAFGALIMMRDEPMDAPIPDEFTDDGFYDKLVAEGRAKLAELQSCSPEAAEALAKADYASAMSAHEREVERVAKTRARYERMLADVSGWEAAERFGELKRFMIDQLKQSIQFDCYTPTPPEKRSPAEWLAESIREVKRTLRHAEESAAKSAGVTSDRNGWLAALRASVGPPPAPRKR
jgi:hypothetical protein